MTAGGPGLGGLSRKRALARAALWWEATWPALWPPLGVLGLWGIFALLGLPALLPGWLHGLILLGFLAALGLAARRGFTQFRAPDDAAVDRRLERETGLKHRPLATLQDQPATREPEALALWDAHQARMRRLVTRLRVGTPRPGLAARDPHALRAAVLIAFSAVLVVAGADAPALLARSLVPNFGTVAPPAPLRFEAWVTPPTYTGAPPIFLPALGGNATIPAGSRLQVAIAGGIGAAPEITGLPGVGFEALGAGSHTAQAVMQQGARVTIRREGTEIVTWNLAVQADAPPIAAFTEVPARSPRGLALRLPWRTEDDWGVVALRAEFRLAARPDTAPISLDMTLPSAAPKQARGLAQPDLSAHPWAGLPVVLRLTARDGADQEGVSEEIALTLPERSFNHPVARAMIEIRKALSLDPTARLDAMRELDRLTQAPDAFEHDSGTLLALRTTRGQLQRDRRPEAIAEVQELLWEAALALEEGRDTRTARALAEAQRQLREAMNEAERTPNAENQQQRSEVERRIEQLREAIRRHLEAMAERLQRENAEALPYDPQQRMLDQRDMDRRTRRMEEANRQNRMEDAQRELAELEEMLRALQEGRVARSESPERQRQRERGQQQMGAVQDMVRRQGEMVDQGGRRAEQQEQRAAQQRRQNQPWNQRPNAPGQTSPEQNQQAEQEAQRQQQADARRQRALRRALGELMQQQGDLTGEVPEALGQADQAMREAMEALGEGRDARPAQQEAMRRLQEGGRQMAQQMQRQFGQGQGEGEGEGEDDSMGEMEMGGDGPDGQQQLGEGRDPLGRRARENTGNADNGSDTRVPDEAELLRTRRLQDELRRRGAERERPAEELDYIDRLLRRF
ncbi:TIGR02302 family protein [Sediminicoccus sp. KRV36]|uniref:TIGR02302 family protein n=1 Tax=Sediminicoccus sp. KRV36 TaxID=3133721 RepID=UPI00200F2CFF|nr:TIGR02302 family protein [Sediminicoccus rosea]UPY37112.1 TIGR02302 family protein [Sediminicoccus rosea]